MSRENRASNDARNLRKTLMGRKSLQLGRRARIPASPEKAVLDRVQNPHVGTNYVARFTAPEFTTLCPITGQPDFAHLVIDYVPARSPRRIEIAQTVPQQLPQSRRVPRRLHGRYRAKALCAPKAEMATHWWLLVSTRRNADRCVLAGRPITERCMGARSGRRPLPRTRLGFQVRPLHPQSANPAGCG